MEMCQVRRFLKSCQVAHTRGTRVKKACESQHIGFCDGIACGFTECLLNHATEVGIRNGWDDLPVFFIRCELIFQACDGREIGDPIASKIELRQVRQARQRRNIRYLIIVKTEKGQCRQTCEG